MPRPQKRSRPVVPLSLMRSLMLTSGFPLVIGIGLLVVSAVILLVGLTTGPTMAVPGGRADTPIWLRGFLLTTAALAFAIGFRITFVAVKATARPGSLLFRLTHW